jgi:hypothetical protein
MLPIPVEVLRAAAVIGRVVIPIPVPEQLLNLLVQPAALSGLWHVVVVCFPLLGRFPCLHLTRRLTGQALRPQFQSVFCHEESPIGPLSSSGLGPLCCLQIPPIFQLHMQQLMVTTPAFVLLLAQLLTDHVSQLAPLALDLAPAAALPQPAQVVFSHQVESCRC